MPRFATGHASRSASEARRASNRRRAASFGRQRSTSRQTANVTPRVFAILVCLFASGRAPRLRYVAAALGCDLFAGELVCSAMTRSLVELASVAWLAPSMIVATLGASMATRSRFVLVCFVGAETIACLLARPSSLPWVAFASCAVSGVQLARQTTPRDAEKSIALTLLAGNAATLAIMLLVGIDRAYESHAVATSNDLTCLAVSALGLWAMRTR